MVAPINSGVGNSANDPTVQGRLTELTNLYNDPKNNGVESEFIASDGTKFKISDASYLSKVKSDVNTGRYDNKSVDANADTKVGSYAEEKKAKADKPDGQDPAAAKSQAESGGGASLSDCFTIVAHTDDMRSSGQQNIDAKKAKIPVAEGKVAKLKSNIDKSSKDKKVAFTKMDQDTATSNAVSAQLETAADRILTKAIAARAAKVAAKQSAQGEESSTTQSGSKMGFEGKLATVAPESTGGGGGGGSSAATDKAWENTMKGKISVSKISIKAETPKLVNVRQAGDKAAQPLLDQAAATSLSADQAVAGESAAEDQANSQQMTQGVGCAVTAYTADQMGGSAVKAWAKVGEAPPGWGTFVAVAIAVGYTVAAIAAAAGALAQGIGFVHTGKQLDRTIAGMEAKEQDLDKQAAQQEGQSVGVRRQAVAQAQLQNAKIMKAQQNLSAVVKECNSGLSSSSMSAINTDGMNEDQLESVKQERYDQIMAHEQEHAAVIGGTPVIETDANGVAVGGYVQIDVPSVDEADLEGTIEKAQRVIDAALAPSDPSSQDQNVASQAKDVLSRAQDKLEEKTADSQKEEDKKPEDKKDEDKQDEVKPELKKDDVKPELKKDDVKPELRKEDKKVA